MELPTSADAQPLTDCLQPPDLSTLQGYRMTRVSQCRLLPNSRAPGVLTHLLRAFWSSLSSSPRNRAASTSCDHDFTALIITSKVPSPQPLWPCDIIRCLAYLWHLPLVVMCLLLSTNSSAIDFAANDAYILYHHVFMGSELCSVGGPGAR